MAETCTEMYIEDLRTVVSLIRDRERRGWAVRQLQLTPRGTAIVVWRRDEARHWLALTGVWEAPGAPTRRITLEGEQLYVCLQDSQPIAVGLDPAADLAAWDEHDGLRRVVVAATPEQLEVCVMRRPPSRLGQQPQQARVIETWKRASACGEVAR